MVGPDGRFLKVNQALCALVGHPEPALLAAGYQAVVHPEDRDADIEQLQRLLDGEATGYQLQQRCRRVDGEAISVLCNTWLATPGTANRCTWTARDGPATWSASWST